MRKIQPNVLTLKLDAQKSFFYPEKPLVVAITFYFMVKVRNTLFLGRNRIQKKSDARPPRSPHCGGGRRPWHGILIY